MIRLVGKQYTSSILLGLVEKNGGKQTVLLKCVAYDKIEEMRSKGKELPAAVASQIAGRLRVDLTLTNRFLRSRWHTEPLLKNVVARARKAGGWRGLVQELWDYWQQKSCMDYMLKCPNPFEVKALREWCHGAPAGREARDIAASLGIDLKIPPAAHARIVVGRKMLEISKTYTGFDLAPLSADELMNLIKNAPASAVPGSMKLELA